MIAAHRSALFRRSTAALLTGVVLTACGIPADHGAPATTVAAWQVDATPLRSVGDRDEGDSTVFSAVTDARLLPNGLLAIADGSAFNVQFFDSLGQRVRSVGRRGRGPNEFTGDMTLMDAPGDSVAVWDPGQTRWTFVDSRSGASRQLLDPIATPVWLHAGILVHSALGVPPVWVAERLRALSAESPEVRVAHLEPSGVLWVRGEPDRREWQVYIDSGAPIASVQLPAAAELLHVGARELVTLVADSLGLQRVEVLALRRAPYATPALTPRSTTPVDARARGALMAGMRFAVMAQERHWMTHQAYTLHADSLELEMPPETRFKLLDATARGWRGVGWYSATGFSCGMIVGWATPAGWSEGEARCGW